MILLRIFSLKKKRKCKISFKMKSIEPINTIDHLDICCILPGYIDLPQKPQEIFQLYLS